MPRKTEPTLVNNVKEFRSERGITQQDLADRVGVTRQTIIALEGDAYAPSLSLAMRIAKVFRIPIEKLFWFEE